MVLGKLFLIFYSVRHMTIGNDMNSVTRNLGRKLPTVVLGLLVGNHYRSPGETGVGRSSRVLRFLVCVSRPVLGNPNTRESKIGRVLYYPSDRVDYYKGGSLKSKKCS